MKFSKTLLMTSILAASFSGSVYAIGNGDTEGTIHFEGQFLDSTCTVETNNESSNVGTVKLGSWLSNTFDTVGEKTKPVPFTISLSGCPATLSTAKVTFKGDPDGTNPDLYKVNEATGVGIGIAGDAAANALYKPNSEAKGITLVNNVGKETYYALYVTTAEAVAPGKANADVTVTIQYGQ